MSDTTKRYSANLNNKNEVDDFKAFDELIFEYQCGLLGQVIDTLNHSTGGESLLQQIQRTPIDQSILQLIKNEPLREQVLAQISNDKALYENVYRAFNYYRRTVEVDVANDVIGKTEITKAPARYTAAKQKQKIGMRTLELIESGAHRIGKSVYYNKIKDEGAFRHSQEYRAEDGGKMEYLPQGQLKNAIPDGKLTQVDIADTAKSFLRKMVAHNDEVAQNHTDREYSEITLKEKGMDQAAIEDALSQTLILIDESIPTP